MTSQDTTTNNPAQTSTTPPETLQQRRPHKQPPTNIPIQTDNGPKTPDPLPDNDPRVFKFVIVNRETFECIYSGKESPHTIPILRPHDKLASEIRVIYQLSDEMDTTSFLAYLSAPDRIQNLITSIFDHILGEGDMSQLSTYHGERGWIDHVFYRRAGATPIQLLSVAWDDIRHLEARVAIADRLIRRAAQMYSMVVPRQGPDNKALTRDLVELMQDLKHYAVKPDDEVINVLSRLEFLQGENRQLLSERHELEVALQEQLPASYDQSAFNIKRERDFLCMENATLRASLEETSKNLRAMCYRAPVTGADAEKLSAAASEAKKTLGEMAEVYNKLFDSNSGGVFGARMNDLVLEVSSKDETIRQLRDRVAEMEIEMRAKETAAAEWRERAKTYSRHRAPAPVSGS